MKRLLSLLLVALTLWSLAFPALAMNLEIPKHPSTARTKVRPKLGEGVDLNLYRYCGNSPTGNIDPDGLETLIYGPGATTRVPGNPASPTAVRIFGTATVVGAIPVLRGLPRIIRDIRTAPIRLTPAPAPRMLRQATAELAKCPAPERQRILEMYLDQVKAVNTWNYTKIAVADGVTSYEGGSGFAYILTDNGILRFGFVSEINAWRIWQIIVR